MALEILYSAGLAAILATVLRNLTGYIKAIMNDGQITTYELKMLGLTFVSMAFYATAFTLLGIDTEISAALAALSDVAINAIKANPIVTPIVKK